MPPHKFYVIEFVGILRILFLEVVKNKETTVNTQRNLHLIISAVMKNESNGDAK